MRESDSFVNFQDDDNMTGGGGLHVQVVTMYVKEN